MSPVDRSTAINDDCNVQRHAVEINRADLDAPPSDRRVACRGCVGCGLSVLVITGQSVGHCCQYLDMTFWLLLLMSSGLTRSELPPQ